MARDWTRAQLCAMTLKNRDILVSAAAGSGKTATLTERIIRSLTETDAAGQYTGDISRMLIVTYTRAAAAKLRSDISDALSRAIAAHPDDARLYRQLTALSSAHISTIDAFCLEPVRAHFERLGLPSSFRIADNAELAPVKEEVFARVMEDTYRRFAVCAPTEDPLSVLADNPFATAMEDVLPLRGREGVTAEILAIYEKLRYYPRGIAILRDSAERLCRESELPFTRCREYAVFRADLQETLRHFSFLLQDAVDAFSAVEPLREKYTPAYADDLDVIERLLRLLDRDEWERAGEVILGYVPTKLGTVSGSDGLLPDMKQLKKVREDFKKWIRGAYRTYFAVGELPLSEQMRHTAETERMLYELLHAYDGALWEEKKRRGILDFLDVSRCLLELLRDEDGNPTEVAKSYGERFDAVYIDEYQDVNAVQDSIFAAIGAGGKRFMVGDMKQSIYRFRGANPGLFADYRRAFSATLDPEEPLPAEGGNCIFMSENFRCAKPVIDFANSVSAYTFSACEDTIGYRPEDALRQGLPTPPDTTPAPVRLVLLENNSAAGEEDTLRGTVPEAVYIAREIRRLLTEEKKADGSPFALSDMAILVHKKEAAGEVIRALSAYGIQTSYAARDQLAQHPDTILLYNLLSVIDNPRDDVPMMGLLSSAESPADLSALLEARNKAPKGYTLYDAIAAAATEAPDGPFSSFCRWLETWRTLAATLPIDRLLRKLYGEPRLAGRAATPPFLLLYDLARKYQNASFCGLYQFLRYYRTLREDPDNLAAPGLVTARESVTLLTIHKSKGLEFPVVFLYGTKRQFNQKDLKASLYFDEEMGVAAPVYMPASASFTETVCRRALYMRMKRQLSEEEMRVLYVALTRPRERLYVTAELANAADELSDAAAKHRDDTHLIFKAKSPLEWILPGLLLRETAPIHPAETAEICVLPRQDYEGLPDLPVGEATADASCPEQTERDFYARVLERHRDYRDERAPFRTLPTKAAASKLRTALLDGAWSPEEFGGEDSPFAPAPTGRETAPAGTAAVKERIALMRGSVKPYADLLAENALADAAERGSATHCFLEHCDFARLLPGTPRTLDEEIARLTEGGFLPARWAAILHRKQLTAFLQSDLFSAIRSSGQIWREVHFDRFVPYSRLTRNPALREKLDAFAYTLYVQGSMDLILEDGAGNLTLVDYKTDRLPASDGETLRQTLLSRHADQLSVYADALTELMGKAPARIWIYSLPLGHCVDLTDAILPTLLQTKNSMHVIHSVMEKEKSTL